MMRKDVIGIVAVCALFILSNGTALSGEGSYHGQDDLAKMMAGTKAQAAVEGTKAGSTVSGLVNFTQTKDGVQVVAKLSGLTPGKHGFHVHEYGSCADSGKAAGGHFNPFGTQHGYLPDDGMVKAHTGDMGNIDIAENGKGTLTVTLPGVKIAGFHGIAGRAVIVHEKPDDFGQPTGNAGARVGCGAIVLTSVPEMAPKGSPKGSPKKEGGSPKGSY